MGKFRKSLAAYAEEKHRPELLQEYSTANPLPATDLGCSATDPVEWICTAGHREIESVRQRIRRGHCAQCASAARGTFAKSDPDMLSIWGKENTVSPYEIPPNYSKPVHWQCPEGHTWVRKISIQRQANCCPVCKSSLFFLMPELLPQWDSDANPGIDPQAVYAYSNTPLHWKCSNGHSYTASPAHMMRRHTRCPICASFGFQSPAAAAEWHPDKNGDKTPYDYTVNSQKDGWFICAQCGHEYMSRITNRAHRKSLFCDHCRKGQSRK